MKGSGGCQVRQILNLGEVVDNQTDLPVNSSPSMEGITVKVITPCGTLKSLELCSGNHMSETSLGTDSPLGRAITDKPTAPQTLNIRTPQGTHEWKVVKISA